MKSTKGYSHNGVWVRFESDPEFEMIDWSKVPWDQVDKTRNRFQTGELVCGTEPGYVHGYRLGNRESAIALVVDRKDIQITDSECLFVRNWLDPETPVKVSRWWNQSPTDHRDG